MFQYKIEKNEYLAQDEELCNSYQQLLKDCEDLKFLMEKFSEELYVIYFYLINNRFIN